MRSFSSIVTIFPVLYFKVEIQPKIQGYPQIIDMIMDLSAGWHGMIGCSGAVLPRYTGTIETLSIWYSLYGCDYHDLSFLLLEAPSYILLYFVFSILWNDLLDAGGCLNMFIIRSQLVNIYSLNEFIFFIYISQLMPFHHSFVQI